MKAFPMFIKTSGRRVVIIGGGEQAAQKARLLLKTDAEIVFIAHEVDDEIAGLIANGRARQETELSAPALRGAAMVFVATGSVVADHAAHALAKEAGCIVNVVDRPDLCDMTTPAIVDRDPIVVAIGSEGTAPVMTRDIKTRVEQMLPQGLGGLAALAGQLRARVAERLPRDDHRAFWAWVFKGAPRDIWEAGQQRKAAKMIKAAITAGGQPEADRAGHVALVGAGPGARDLMTLRAVQRLQEADVIFYDRLVDEEVLELARRDARRVFVGKHVGAHAWPQDRINAIILAEAQQGQRVVRLKSGDPGVFGRAGEELATLKAAGISCEIVPGVTAAFATAAAFGQSLTERGTSDTLVLTTGTGSDADPLPDCVRHVCPGTTTAFYMAARQVHRITDALLARGVPGDAQVQIGVDVSKEAQRLLICQLTELPEMIQRERITGTAMILLTWAKTAPVAASGPFPAMHAPTGAPPLRAANDRTA